MDFSMGLVSTILTLSIFLPFFYAAYLGNQQYKKIQQFFNKEIVHFGYSFEDYEHWGNTFIGLDKGHSALIYMRITKTGLLKEVVPLVHVRECNVLTEFISQKQNGKEYNHLKKVTLSIVLFDQNDYTFFLNFYDFDGPYMENLEISRAEKWKKLVLNHCKPQKPLKSAA